MCISLIIDRPSLTHTHNFIVTICSLSKRSKLFFSIKQHNIYIYIQLVLMFDYQMFKPIIIIIIIFILVTINIIDRYSIGWFESYAPFVSWSVPMQSVFVARNHHSVWLCSFILATLWSIWIFLSFILFFQFFLLLINRFWIGSIWTNRRTINSADRLDCQWSRSDNLSLKHII